MMPLEVKRRCMWAQPDRYQFHHRDRSNESNSIHVVLQTGTADNMHQQHSSQDDESPSRPLTSSIPTGPGVTGSNRAETHYRSRYRTAEIHSQAPYWLASAVSDLQITIRTFFETLL